MKSKKSNVTPPELFSEKISKIGQKKNPTPSKNWNGYFGHFRALAENSYIFILASLEPKLFISKSSTQQKSYRAHTIGQFCHVVMVHPLIHIKNLIEIDKSCCFWFVDSWISCDEWWREGGHTEWHGVVLKKKHRRFPNRPSPPSFAVWATLADLIATL